MSNLHNPVTGEPASGTAKAGGENKPAPGTYIKWYTSSEMIHQTMLTLIQGRRRCRVRAARRAEQNPRGRCTVQPLPDDELQRAPPLLARNPLEDSGSEYTSSEDQDDPD